jgi:hypothetical protein
MGLQKINDDGGGCCGDDKYTDSCEQLRNVFDSIYVAAKNVFTHSHESEIM